MAEHVQATLDRMVDGLIAIRDYGNDFQDHHIHSETDTTTTSTTSDIANSTTTSSTTTSTLMILRPLISQEEMAMIIGRRRTYEYLLRRRQPRQSDFLQYLQYEIQLYHLIQLRYKKYYQSNKAFQKFIQQKKKKMIEEEEDNDVGNKNTTTNSNNNHKYQKKPIQYIIQHIHTLYQRTIRQYRYSYTLIQQYVEFCICVQQQQSSQSSSSVSSKHSIIVPPPPYSSTITKIYQNAIKYHCTNIQLWYDMIRYEYQYYQHPSLLDSTTTTSSSTTTTNHHHDPNTACMATLRILFQRALRFHSQNITLWKSFLTMEWNHCQNRIQYLLLLRRRHSNEDNDHNDDNDDDDVGKEDTEELVTKNSEQHQNDDNNQTNPYRMIQILYDSAIKAIQDEYSNLSFRLQCYQMILHISSNGNQSDEFPTSPSMITLQQYILDSILQYTIDHDTASISTSTTTTSTSTNTMPTKELCVIVRAAICLIKQQQQAAETNPLQSNNTLDNNPVLQIISDACHHHCDMKQYISSPPSITMIYYAMQFLRSYYNYYIVVVTRRNKTPPKENLSDDDDDDDVTLQQIRVMIRDVYTTYHKYMKSITTTMNQSIPIETSNGISFSDVVYEYVTFMIKEDTNGTLSVDAKATKRNQWQDAKQTLHGFLNETTTTIPKSASLYILLAKLTLEIEMNHHQYHHVQNNATAKTLSSDEDVDDDGNRYDSAIALLEQAIQLHVPIHQQPDHFLLLEQLYCLYVAKLTRRNTGSMNKDETTNYAENEDIRGHLLVKIKQLLDQIILVGPKGVACSTTPSRERDVVVVQHIPNILIACQHYVPYLYECSTELAPQQQKLYRQLIDQLILHPSNVMIYQWISQIKMENDTLDETSHSVPPHYSTPNHINIVNLLGTFDELSAPFISIDSTMSNLDTLGDDSMSNKKSSTKTNMTIVQELIEYILEQETTSTMSSVDGKNRLIRLYDQVIFIFQQLSLKVWVRYYQQRKNDNVLYGNTKKKRPLALPMSSDIGSTSKLIKTNSNTRQKVMEDNKSFSIPMVDMNDEHFQVDEIIKLYEQYQIVHVKNAMTLSTTTATTKGTEDKPSMSWKDIGSTFQKLNDMDKKSWCIETHTPTSQNGIIPERFLSPVITKDRAYCSFLVQHSKDVNADTMASLPFQEFDTPLMQYEKAIWFFFGRNPIGNVNMDGRPEHTDAISHSGTWHYQLSGCKRWLVRPTTVMMNQQTYLDETSARTFFVNCKEGDVLMINTRLWFHQTIIPPQRIPSVSYARDFRLINSGKNQLTLTPANDESCTMTNVDGMYATKDISTGTVIFTEVDMPDCELHRSSTDPNCEVVELEDGTSAVVASRPISSGEFFCVPESSDEEEDSIENDNESSL